MSQARSWGFNCSLYLEWLSLFHSTVFSLFIKELFISSLRPLNIFIIAILKSLTYASAILNFSEPTVVGLLCTGGDIFSYLTDTGCVFVQVFTYLGFG